MTERRFRFSKIALRGPLEVFDLPHPAGQCKIAGEIATQAPDQTANRFHLGQIWAITPHPRLRR